MLLERISNPETLPDTPPAPTAKPQPHKRGLAGIAPATDQGPRYGPGRRREAKPIPHYPALPKDQVAEKIRRLIAYLDDHGTGGLVDYEAALTRELVAQSAGKATKPDNGPPDPWGTRAGGDLALAGMSGPRKSKAPRNASWKPRLATWPTPGAHRIDLARGAVSQTYTVTYNRELIVKDSRTPTLDAARALVARGMTGKLEVYAGEPYPRLVLDIEQAAGLTVQDDSQGRPTFRPFKPNDEDDPSETATTN